MENSAKNPRWYLPGTIPGFLAPYSQKIKIPLPVHLSRIRLI